MRQAFTLNSRLTAMLIGLCVSNLAIAQATLIVDASTSQLAANTIQSFVKPASFMERGLVGAGSANATSPNQGAYVYTPQQDQRKRYAAFLVGAPKRQEYDLFSDQEEQALWEVKQSLLAPYVTKVRHAGHTLLASASKELWPRVVVQGERVCVPVLPYANGDDWREHLTCWTKGEGAQ